jgi:voltage-gated potassium channel
VVKVSRRERDLDETLAAQPGYALVGVVRVPEVQLSPMQAIWRRIALALLALAAAVVTVYLGRNGYTDNRGGQLTFLDCLYFATVSLTTVGYGDVTPYTEFARLISVLVLTPLRILFLVVLVGTTLQVLTERSRQAWKIQRWRSTVRNHTVVIGYGTKGKTAIGAMCGDEAAGKDFVVVDIDHAALDHAAAADLVTVHGDATRPSTRPLSSSRPAAMTPQRWSLSPRGKSRRTPRSSRRFARPKTSTCSSNPAPTRWSSPPKQPADYSAWRLLRPASSR